MAQWLAPAFLSPVVAEHGCVFDHEMAAAPRAYAAMLYDALHRLESAGLDWIANYCTPVR
jgi:hypothetical protein